jgi:hypothetical protein
MFTNKRGNYPLLVINDTRDKQCALSFVCPLATLLAQVRWV